MNCFKRKVLSLLLMLAAVAAVAGCAKDQDTLRIQAESVTAQANARVAEATRDAEEARAVQRLADKIDAGGASAYLIAKAMRGMATQQPVQVVQQQPQSLLGLAWQSILQVADIALRGYGIKANRDVSIRTSDNNRDVSLASYGAFVGMGNAIANAGTAGYPYIQAPGAVTTNTLSGTGVLGSGTYTAPITTTTTTTSNCQGGSAAQGGNGGSGTTSGGAGATGGSAAGGSC